MHCVRKAGVLKPSGKARAAQKQYYPKCFPVDAIGFREVSLLTQEIEVENNRKDVISKGFWISDSHHETP